MKEKNIYIQAIKREITFYIGERKEENFDVIDKGELHDLWFHADDNSSCHIVCKVPPDIDKKDLKYLISTGAVLCKSNTNKLKSINNVTIVYTNIKNIIKTDIPGRVISTNLKQKII
jgi:predicted ribosome quality control (RQC) complex YloA/Tae2 family protein